MTEWKCVCVYKKTHTDTPQNHLYTHLGLCERLPHLFSHFFIIISRDLDSCVSVCSVYMRRTFCVFFYHLFRHNLLYKHARQLHSTNCSVCWMCVFFLSFVSFFLFNSFAAVFYEKKNSYFACAHWQRNTIDFIYYCQVRTWAEPTSGRFADE